jgi:hypothetical protein
MRPDVEPDSGELAINITQWAVKVIKQTVFFRENNIGTPVFIPDLGIDISVGGVGCDIEEK